jgi:orotidine-5'-phosphate decarboxylase
MVRSGDQEQPFPGGTRSAKESPQVPAARTSRLSARRRGAGTADTQASGAGTRFADAGDARRVPVRSAAPLEPAVPGDRAAPGQPAAPGPDAVPSQATLPDWDVWAARRARVPPGAPESSAADLRELAELGDLLGELAGLVRDLGALIMGLITAAADAGGRRRRTFAVPAELAELARAHQELKAEQLALSALFESGDGNGPDRTALRASLAALTERATRAVAVAAAVSFPEGQPQVPPAAGGGQVPPAAGGGQDQGPGPRPPSGPPQAPAAAVTAPRAAPGAPRAAPGAPRAAPGAPRAATGVPSRNPPRKENRVQKQAPVAVALDAPDIDVAAHWATLVTPYVSTVKIGLELYLRYGPTVVATVRGGSGVQVFLDLKLHDIPNTVAGAARAVAKLRPEILTVHAAGGADMIKAAVQAAPETLVAGVTLLTSIGGKDLADVGVGGSVSDAVRRMAGLAVSAGARGLVCSPQEVAAVRAEVGPDILLITPGIRPAGVTSDDQARIATPVEALRAGADLLVIGRPITRAADPGAAASAIAMSLRRAVAAR